MGETQQLVCDRCGMKYTAHPVPSKSDPNVLLCPECGTRDNLQDMGLSEKEQEQIIQTMKNEKVI